MNPLLVTIALGVTTIALAVAWTVRRKLRPGVLAARRAVLEGLSASALIGPLLHHLAQQGWRIDGARSAHAEGFEHVVKRDHEVGLLGLRRGKQADLEPHQLDHLVDIARAWGANRVWLLCTGRISRGAGHGADASSLSLIEVDELWRMHAHLLSAGARAAADRAQHRLMATVLGSGLGVLLFGGLLTWAAWSPWSSTGDSRGEVAIPDQQAFSSAGPVPEASSPPIAELQATGRDAIAKPSESTAIPDSTAPALPWTDADSAEKAMGESESEFVAAAPNLPARKQFAHEVTALPAVRRAGWASASTLVIHLHPGHRVEEIADLTCSMAAKSPDLGALRLQLLEPSQDEQPTTPRWRLCR